MAAKRPKKAPAKKEVERRVEEKIGYDDCIREICRDFFEESTKKLEVNVTTCIVEAFINCIKKFRDKFEFTQFSKSITLNLFKSYNKTVQDRLLQINKYLGEIKLILEKLHSKDNVKEFLLEVETRVVIHVRNPYIPLEIGVAWHPIFNVPYIPATSIKGLVRSYMELKKEEEKVELKICGKDVNEIFGKGGETSIEGLVIFHDALPIETSPNGRLIEPEIVNPHYSEVKRAIRETDVKPVPIVYPAIATGTRFKLITIFRDKIFTQLNCCNEFSEILSEALQEGLGAKTRLGYGIIRLHKS